MNERVAEELRTQLNEGLARSGLSTEQAAVRSRLGRTTVSQALNSTDRVPTARTVAALAKTFRLDEQGLLNLQQAASGEEPIAVDGLGTPISECDPLDLEVHPAGAARDAAKTLPGYVRRAHDDALAEVVAAAAAGRSGMAVLVGTSSTGKTRACWEAVQPLAAAGWRLWHPYDPTHASAALHGLARVAPRTVVWLNEAQHYLDAGEQMAAALHGLLIDSDRAPVLVLATLWPDYDKLYADRPDLGMPDPHARTRALLSGRRVEVASEFDDADRRKAERLAKAGDLLWAGVLTHDHRGRLAQHLAGAPELVRRYMEVSPTAKALLRAAMDLRRLGVGPHLPLAFLTDAAEDYLHHEDLHLLEDEDWLERALAELAKPVHGDLAPLRRVHLRRQRHCPVAEVTAPAMPPSEPSYRLADYLEQHGRRERRLFCPPLSFWDAAHEFLNDSDDLAKLGRAAQKRYRLSWAEALYLRAADNSTALTGLAEIREIFGDSDEAEALYQRAADAGDAAACERIAEIHEKTSRAPNTRASVPGIRITMDADDLAQFRLSSEFLRLSRSYEKDGKPGEAEAFYQRAADAGNVFALSQLALIREEVGDHSEAERLSILSANAGLPLALMVIRYERKTNTLWPFGLEPDGTPSSSKWMTL